MPGRRAASSAPAAGADRLAERLRRPELVGDFALPAEELSKLPGCRQPKDQDVAEAKRLVERHHPNGLDVEISIRAVGNYLDRAQLVLSQLRKAGIRGTLKSLESAAGFAAFGKGDFALIATQDRAMDTPDPESLFSVIYFTDARSSSRRLRASAGNDAR